MVASTASHRRTALLATTSYPDRTSPVLRGKWVMEVLLGTPPPENGVHNKIAFKTGTSYGYRDAWSVGFDGRITIGVWVGRPDGVE